MFFFLNLLRDFFVEKYTPEIILPPENNEVLALEERNKSKEWLFPERSFVSDYTVVNKQRFSYGTICLEFFMKNETVQKVQLSGDFFEIAPLNEILEEFSGKTIAEIAENAQNIDVENYIYGMSRNDFINLLKG